MGYFSIKVIELCKLVDKSVFSWTKIFKCDLKIDEQVLDCMDRNDTVSVVFSDLLHLVMLWL